MFHDTQSAKVLNGKQVLGTASAASSGFADKTSPHLTSMERCL